MNTKTSTADPREVERIITVASGWFTGAALSAALGLAGALAGNWRPADLPTGNGIVWWIGAVFVALSIAAFAWAGCPVLRTDPATADRSRSLTIRLGVVLYVLGAVAAAVAVLAAPGTH